MQVMGGVQRPHTWQVGPIQMYKLGNIEIHSSQYVISCCLVSPGNLPLGNSASFPGPPLQIIAHLASKELMPGTAGHPQQSFYLVCVGAIEYVIRWFECGSLGDVI